MNKILNAWVSFLQKAYLLIVLLGFYLAYLSMPHMVGLLKNISTDPVDLLPQDNASVKALLKIRDKFENKTGFGIVFESSDAEASKKLIEDLKTKYANHPQIGRVIDQKTGYSYFYNNKLLFLELEDLRDIKERIDRKIQQEKLGGFYINFDDEDSKDKELDFHDLESKYKGKYGAGNDNAYYVTPDGKGRLIYLETRQATLPLPELAKLQTELENDLKAIDVTKYAPDMKVYFAGVTKVIEYRSLQNDLKKAGILSAILMFLPLLIRFRRPDHVLLIFIPMVIGIPLGFWISTFWISKLNVTTSFLFAILGGLGIETGIHIFSRYTEKRQMKSGQKNALMDIYTHLGPSVSTAVASLAVTFLLLLYSDFRGFSEFGLISGVGLITLFILYFTFFPALIISSEKIGLLKIKEVELEEIKVRNFKPSASFVKTLLWIFSVFTVFSCVVTPGVKFEYNSKKIRSDNPEFKEAKIKQRLAEGGRTNNPALVLVDNEEEANALTQALQERKKQNPNSALDLFRSYYSLVPDKQDDKLVEVSEMKKLLEDDTLKLVKDEYKGDLDEFKKALNETHKVSRKDVPQELEEMFSGKPDTPGKLYFIQSKPFMEMDDGRNAIKFSNELSNIKAKNGVIYHPANDAIVYGEVLQTMFRDSKWVLLFSVLSLSFFVYINFRSLKKTSLVMFSIVSGVFWVMGVIYLLGFPLNMYNMVMIPAIMGMSIDNSIHIYHSYEELGKGSLGKVLASAGLSCLLASLTNAAGFLGLLVCSHGGLRSMGILASIGLATCLISTLVFLPMMLQFLESRKLKVRN